MGIIIPPKNNFARYKLVAGRCQILGQNSDSGGTNTQSMGRQKLNTFFPFSDPVLVFTNWGANGTSGEYAPAPAGAITLTASVEQSGNFYQATRNGATAFTVPLNGTIWTDPVACDVASGTNCYARWFLSVASGNKWNRGYQCISGTIQDYVTEGTALTDQTMGGTLSYVMGSSYGVSALLGLTMTPKLAIAGLGDSLMWGQGDDPTGLGAPSGSTGDGNGNFGWLQRAAYNSGVPCLVLARPGDQASYNLTTNSKRRRLVTGPTGPIVDWVIVNLGTNDATNGQTYTQLKTNLTTIVAGFQQRGVKVCLCTITPRTTSTDSWATVTNQTLAAGHTLSDAPALVNADLRAGNRYGADGVYDLAAQVESSLGSGKWAANSTADGLHPNQAAHIAIASNAAANLIAGLGAG